MLCAALLDAGLNEVQWRETLEQLSWRMSTLLQACNARCVCCDTYDIRPPAQKEQQAESAPPIGHGHHHAHGHHAHTHVHSPLHDSAPRNTMSGPTPVPWSAHHRGFTDISNLIESSPLPAPVKKNAIQVFRVLGGFGARHSWDFTGRNTLS